MFVLNKLKLPYKIRAFEVTASNEYDKAQLERLLDAVPKNDNRVWADGAYYSADEENRLKEKGVEHVFGFMQNSMKGKFIRTIGLMRAKIKVGVMNLVYNLCRYEQLCRIGASSICYNSI